jgi:hypothetical protein
MAQIMKYYEYPTKGVGSHSYTHPVYGTLSADFGSTTYNYSSMANTYSHESNYQESEIRDVATLMYHCGVALEIDYGATGSSADNYDISDAFKNYFGFASGGTHLGKDNNPAIWNALLVNE